MNTLTANEQARANELQPLLSELYRVYYDLPMHAHTATEKLFDYGMLLLAEWYDSSEVPSQASRRMLVVAYAVQATIKQHQETRHKP